MDPQFNLIRAVFWLLAVVVVLTMVMIMFAAGTCTMAVFLGWHEPGTCLKAGIGQELHDLWSEILTAILALLAARPHPPPGGPDDKGDKDAHS